MIRQRNQPLLFFARSPEGLGSIRHDLLLHASNSRQSSSTTECSTEFCHVFFSEMDDRPFRLDEFATFYGNHLKWTEEKPSYIRRSVLVNEMYNMLQEYEGKIPPNDQVN